MKKFYYDVVTFISGLSPILKCLILAVLMFINIMLVIKIVKTHVNPKKLAFKIGQFIILAIFVAITIFVLAHV